VAGTDLLGNSATRPYLVLSNSQRPFQHEECIVAVVTTTERGDAIRLDESDFTAGLLPRQSYVSPWNPLTLKDAMITKQVATVTDAVVDETVAELNTYLETES
jgi:mRNA interferase MazF